MPSISERIRSNPLFKRHKSGVISTEPIQFPGLIMDRITEKEEMGKEMARIAQEFLRTAGVESLFRHVNNDHLNGKGIMRTSIRSNYILHGTDPSIPYSADISLMWPKGWILPSLFTLKTSLYGNALYSDPEKPPRNKVLYKTLSISLDEKGSKPSSEQPRTIDSDYKEHYFSTENPSGREIVSVMMWADDTIASLINEKGTLRGKSIF